MPRELYRARSSDAPRSRSSILKNVTEGLRRLRSNTSLPDLSNASMSEQFHQIQLAASQEASSTLYPSLTGPTRTSVSNDTYIDLMDQDTQTSKVDTHHASTPAQVFGPSAAFTMGNLHDDDDSNEESQYATTPVSYTHLRAHETDS